MSEINDKNFHHVLLQAPAPVLLIFRGTFCGPSALYSDIIAEAQAEFGEDEVIFLDVDVEECPRLTREMQIKGTPTALLLDEAVPIASVIGTTTVDKFIDWLDEQLKKPEGKGGKKK